MAVESQWRRPSLCFRLSDEGDGMYVYMSPFLVVMMDVHRLNVGVQWGALD